MANVKISDIASGTPALTDVMELQRTGAGASLSATVAAIFATPSPTLVTPLLGTPTSVTLTNATGLPAAGVVGTAAILGANTFTGDQTLSSASLIMSGNISAAAWTTNGIRIKGVASTLTDTSSSGTVAAAYTDVLGGNTIAASSATTFTVYASAFIKNPIAGSNVTIGTKYSLALEGGIKAPGRSDFGNDLYVTSNLSVGGGLYFGSAGQYGQISTDLVDANFRFASNNFTKVVRFSVPLSTVWQQGAADAAAPVAQTYQVQGSRAGTDNDVAGANFTIQSGAGTGSSTGSSLIFKTPLAVASGTGAQTMTAGLTLSAGSKIGFYTAAGAVQSTGYGTPTNGAKQASFDATTITLPNLAAAVAQLILDLKSVGLVAA